MLAAIILSIITIIITFNIIIIIVIIIMVIVFSNLYYYNCNFHIYYQWASYQMTSYQILTFFCEFLLIHICSTSSPQKQKQKFFLRDHNGNKATQLFCVIPAIAPHIYVSIFIVDLFEKAM